MNPALRNLYDWLFVIGTLASATWLALTLFGQSPSWADGGVMMGLHDSSASAPSFGRRRELLCALRRRGLRYLREQASQDIKRRVATCFVAITTGKSNVAGYYTLAATGIALSNLSEEVAKKLPRYPVVPAALLGRLAESKAWQGKELGSALIADALLRTARTELGVFALLVDAKDDAACQFYEHFGFTRLLDHERRLMLPIATALPN